MVFLQAVFSAGNLMNQRSYYLDYQTALVLQQSRWAKAHRLPTPQLPVTFKS
jgi:hypothetical protein